MEWGPHNSYPYGPVEDEPYRYARLRDASTDLRLVEIDPGTGMDAMSCRMHTYSLDKCPSYEALSYAWGDNSQKLRIILNSGNENKSFYVTLNLYSALRNLRKRRTGQTVDRRLLIWIDALCIDQENLEERNDQVQRMKAIYQQAKRVVVYLGDYDEPVDSRLQFPNEIWGINSLEQGSYYLTLAAITIALRLSSVNTVANDEEVFQMLAESTHEARHGNPLSNIHAWAHLSRLFNRSWFERLWIIQELGVSQEAIVLCGGIEVPWPAIEDAAAFILRPSPATPAAIQKFLPLMGAHRVTQVALNTVSDIDKDNILTVLRHTQGASCSDPRDKLYAILGVVEDAKDVEIDYSKPVEAVYRDWAISRILRTNSLDILSACADSGKTAALPSWVPDLRWPWAHDKELWRVTHKQDPFESFLRGKDLVRIGHYIVAMPWNRRDLFPENDFQLALTGSLIEEIVSLSSVGDAVTNLDNPSDLTTRLLDIINDWENWFQQKVFSLDLPSNIKENAFRTSLLREESGASGSGLSEQYTRWRPHVLTTPSLGAPLLSQYLRPELRAFERKLFSLLHGCQMFVTERGNTGVVAGNCNARINDQIYFLSGGMTPFILRRESDKHRLISPCFLNEHMTQRPSVYTNFYSSYKLRLETIVLV